MDLLSQLLIGSRPDQEVTTRIYPGFGMLDYVGYLHRLTVARERRGALMPWELMTRRTRPGWMSEVPMKLPYRTTG